VYSQLFYLLNTARFRPIGICHACLCSYPKRHSLGLALRQKTGTFLTPFQSQQLPSFQKTLKKHLNASDKDVIDILTIGDSILLNLHTSSIEHHIVQLKETYLVQPNQLLTILKSNAKWMTKSTDEIKDLLECVCVGGVLLDQIGYVLKNYPDLLSLDADEFVHRVNFFNDKKFTLKEKQIILLEFPEILNRDVTELEKIYNYVKETFNMNHDDILKSMVFKYSFTVVFCRFEFMRKRGLYIGRDKRGIYPANRQSHPAKIMTSNLTKFLNEVALSSLEEFSAFCDSFPPHVKEMLEQVNSNNQTEYLDQDLPVDAVQDFVVSERESENQLWQYLKSKYSEN